MNEAKKEITIPMEIAVNPNLRPRSVLLYGLLRAEGGTVNVPKLAAVLNVSDRTVTDCLRELRTAGIIPRTKQAVTSTVELKD